MAVSLFNHKLKRPLVAYLNKVDDEYITAFNIKSMRNLSKYLTRECQVKVLQRISCNNNRYFGSSKFRHTEWSRVKSIDPEAIVVKKVVVFDKIGVAGPVSMNVANDYKEIWTMVKYGSSLLVSDIEECD